MPELRENVTLENLQEGMRILSVTKLDEKYEMVDSQSLAKLRDHLPGAEYDIERKGNRQRTDVSGIQTFDRVIAIREIPGEGELASVGPSTAAELKNLGFYRFTVLAPDEAPPAPKTAQAPARLRQPTSNDPAVQARLTAAKQFLESMEASDQQRDRSAQAIEDAMEDARRGNLGRSAVDQAISNVVEQGMAPAMSAIAGLKASDQTYAHCVDMSVIYSLAYQELVRAKLVRNPLPEGDSLVAGFMHDIGKCQVPKEILESTQRFDPQGPEMAKMRSHAAAGAQILSDLGFGQDVVNVAHYHHVKKDTSLNSSYPKASYDEVLPVTRLAAIADVYQALIGKRSYKKNWVPGKAVQFLMGLKGKEFDEQYLGVFLRSVGIYPVGSLVRLNTGHAAFVLRNESDKLERPVIVTVETPSGERLSQSDLIDLMAAPDIQITEVLDHYEHYSESLEQPYEVFSSVRV